MTMTVLAFCLAFMAVGAVGATRALAAEPVGRSRLLARTPQEVLELEIGRSTTIERLGELSGLPSPHVLAENVAHLSLAPSQHDKLAALRKASDASTRAAGRSVIDAELSLERAFSTGPPQPVTLARLVRRAEEASGDLRIVILQSMIDCERILTAAQLRRYFELRRLQPRMIRSIDA
ncbi:MAG TPA: hypothetical protein PK264_09165 [Hyphomicrobiaceae bacterium]|nr:hypothetical protein [Hyphomicrobiaceae bacterium]